MSRAARLWIASLFLASCVHGPRTVTAPPGWSSYLEGDAEVARKALAARSDLLSSLGHANLVHDSARYAEARDLWLDLVRKASRGGDSPWNRAVAAFAAHRISVLRDEVGGPSPEWATGLEGAADSPVGPEARLILASSAAGEWMHLGQPQRARRLDEQRGCPGRVRVAGPEPAPVHQRLAAPWSRAAKDAGGDPVRASSCVIPLRDPEGRGGVYTITVDLHAPKATDILLWIDSGSPFALDGYLHDSPDRFLQRRVWLRAKAPAGVSRLVLRAIAPARGALALGLLDPDGGPAAVDFGEAARGSPRIFGFAPIFPSAPPEVRGSARAVSLLLSAHERYRYRDADGARERLGVLRRLAPRFAPAWALLAAVDLVDPALPRSMARDRAARSLERAWKLDSTMARAAHNLVLIAREDERMDEAEEWIQAGRKTAPNAFQFDLLEAEIFLQRSWDREAADALDRARTRQKNACGALQTALSMARRAEDPAAEERLVEQLVRCDATSDARAGLLRRRGQLSEARDEYLRLLRLEPDRAGWKLALADLRVALGDREAARQDLRAMLKEDPRDVEARRRLADLAWAGGQKEEARRILKEGLRLDPGSSLLRQSLRATGWRDPLEDFRVDRAEVVRAFENDAWRPGKDAPAVIVLDRTVLLVADDGSSRALTHNIIRVLTKDGIERFGEVDVPRNAEVLAVRTLKANGEEREAQSIAGKDSLSAPDLEVGDYVELEWVDHAPPLDREGSFEADRFYFRSYDAPLYRTEYVVATPEDMSIEIDTRARGPAPKEELRDGRRVLHFAMARMDQLVPEPAAGPFLDEVPSVRVASGATWESWRDRLADTVFTNGRIGTEAASLARRLCATQRGLACVQAIYDQVAQIKQRGSALQSASESFFERAGSRLMVLRALLRAVGFEPEVWLARPRQADVAEGQIPETQLFTTAVLRLPIGEDVLWLDPRPRWAPPGHVPPALRGARALDVEAGGEVRWGEIGQGTGEDKRTRDLVVDLRADGSATIKGEEKMWGWPAVALRETLEQIAPDRVEEQFEQRWLGFYFPGLVLESLELKGREEMGRPLQVSYGFSAPRVARAQAAELGIPLAFFPAMIGRAYVGVSARRAALQVEEQSRSIERARVAIPSGHRVVSLPKDVRLDTPFGSYRRQVRLDGQSIAVEREIFMPLQRVSPADYAAFVAFASKVDAHDAEEALLRRK